jgi:hypothetical protein
MQRAKMALGLTRMQPITPPTLTGNRRHFSLELECDGAPYHYHTSASDSQDACRRAVTAVAYREGVSLRNLRVVACLDRGHA